MEDEEKCVESGGKRVHKISQKIGGVYTPYQRLKGLFKSDKRLSIDY